MIYTATLRFKDKHNKIIGFRILCNRSTKNFRDYNIDKLKQLMAEDLIRIENLKLTSDNKIIETLVNKQEKVKLEAFRNGVPCGVYYVEGTHDEYDIKVQERKQEILLEDPGLYIHCSTEVTSAVSPIKNIIAKYDAKSKKFKPYIIQNIK